MSKERKLEAIKSAAFQALEVLENGFNEITDEDFLRGSGMIFKATWGEESEGVIRAEANVSIIDDPDKPSREVGHSRVSTRWKASEP